MHRFFGSLTEITLVFMAKASRLYIAFAKRADHVQLSVIISMQGINDRVRWLVTFPSYATEGL